MTATSAAPFGTVLTAMVTPFHEDGSVDLDGVQKVAKHLVDHGHDGIVVSGTTGESTTTTKEEDGEIIVAVKEAVGDRARIVAGVGTNDTSTSIWLAQQARKSGADGVLLVTPYYNKPGQRGVLHHFRQVVDAAELPVMLYDIPGRTGTQLAMETYEAMVDWEPVVAVKDAVGDMVRGLRIQQLGYSIYSGDDVANLAWLAHGAVGFVSVCGHVIGDRLREMHDVFPTDPGRAREVFTGVLPAIDAIMGAPNYGATTAKAALELTGILPNRVVRSPLVPLDDDEVAGLRAGLESAGVL
jgi:4-hydroxy-tetrahydrodipicolinate synthase